METKTQRDLSGEEKKVQKGTVVVKAESLPFFAEPRDRVGVADRGVYLFSTSLLDDFGLVDKNCLVV